MRTLFTTIAIGLVAALLSSTPAKSKDNEWSDLFALDLKDWSRSGTGKTPWRMTTDRTLYRERGSELYIPEREFKNGTFKFEYRFRPNGEKTGFKAGVWARRTLHDTGCRVALGDDCGTLTTTFQGGSDRVKTVDERSRVKAAKPIGEWNEVRIRLEGKTVTVFVNETEVTSSNQCETSGSMIALEGDGSEVEFRNVLWKEAK